MDGRRCSYLYHLLTDFFTKNIDLGRKGGSEEEREVGSEGGTGREGRSKGGRREREREGRREGGRREGGGWEYRKMAMGRGRMQEVGGRREGKRERRKGDGMRVEGNG